MDITHYYVEKGQGEPLILLHGNGESSDYFKNQIDVFAEKYHVFIRFSAQEGMFQQTGCAVFH